MQKQISIRLERDLIARSKALARRLALQENRDWMWTDVVRFSRWRNSFASTAKKDPEQRRVRTQRKRQRIIREAGQPLVVAR